MTYTIPSRICCGLAALAAAAAFGLAASSAWAASPAPAFSLSSVGQPTDFAPGSSYNQTVASSTGRADEYLVTATEIGAEPTDGTPITVTDQLPSGLTLDAAGASGQDDAGNSVSCTVDSSQTLVTCVDDDATPLEPGQRVIVTVPFDVASGASGTVTNSVSVSGGAAPLVAASSQDQISSSAPPFGVQAFSMAPTDVDGSPYTQAGGHPYELSTDIAFPTSLDSNDIPIPDENMKDIGVQLPPGLVGDPSATPKCARPDFDGNGNGIPECAPSTQVGTLTVRMSDAVIGPFPVYNLVPPGNLPAQLGVNILNIPVFIDTQVRTGSDYGLTSTITNISEDLPVVESTLTLWGVPADPSHDTERDCQGGGTGCASGAPSEPFLTMPTSCPGTPLTFTASGDSWENIGSFSSASTTSPATTGCDQLAFNPTIGVQPDTTAADSPAGLSVDLKVPQSNAYDGLESADLKRAVVTLPAGVSLDPSSANGLAACTPREIGMGNAAEPACPDASKVGSVEVASPLLPDPLEGSIYVAQQDQNPFGSLLAIYVTAEADGVLIKLAGDVAADPVTGQLTTTFDNNPQLPFSDFKLTFFGGPRGVLATPDACGTYTSTSDLSPWSGGSDSVSSDPFTIPSGCVSGFSPTFTAGTQNPQAGAYSPFVLSFSRSDTDQELSGLTVTLPPGMVAKLAGVQECSDAQLAQAAANSGAAEQANPSCPANSQVGTVETGSGPGPDSEFLPGRAYLTGPYKGAPYGLAVVVPALAGPYDLGTVVVREALYIDPTTAQVTAVSDPFPTILQGIPLRIRRIDVDLDRADFTINPTNCNPMMVTGILSSTGGLSASVASPFQVGGCQELAFAPKLAISLTGKGKTKSGDHPTLTATLTQPFGGQANIASAKVALPLSLALDPNNSQHVCNYNTAQAVHGGPVGCPASTIVGSATAVTPLLSQPLSGPVYLVQGIRFGKNGQQIHTLPSLLIPLRGQIALDLRAQSSVNGAEQLVTTFSTVPDAPVTKFTLQINGGPKGILVITGRGQTICGKTQIANANFGAQSGKTETLNPNISRPACSGYHKPKKHKKRKKRKK